MQKAEAACSTLDSPVHPSHNGLHLQHPIPVTAIKPEMGPGLTLHR